MTQHNERSDAFPLDIEALLHPAQAFSHPRDVVNDPDLTVNEKRAILASWASDASAVEAAPALRQIPGSAALVTIDAILEALQTLDRIAQGADSARWRRQHRRMSLDAFRERRVPAAGKRTCQWDEPRSEVEEPGGPTRN